MKNCQVCGLMYPENYASCPWCASDQLEAITEDQFTLEQKKKSEEELWDSILTSKSLPDTNWD